MEQLNVKAVDSDSRRDGWCYQHRLQQDEHKSAWGNLSYMRSKKLENRTAVTIRVWFKLLEHYRKRGQRNYVHKIWKKSV